MKEIENLVAKNLEYEEHLAILECSKLLEKAFKKKVYKVRINPHTKDPQEVFGLCFGFDLVARKKD